MRVSFTVYIVHNGYSYFTPIYLYCTFVAMPPWHAQLRTHAHTHTTARTPHSPSSQPSLLRPAACDTCTCTRTRRRRTGRRTGPGPLAPLGARLEPLDESYNVPLE